MVGFLVAQQIVEQIDRQTIENADKGCISPASYELRVGSYFESKKGDPVTLRLNETVVLQPNGFLLVGTHETVHFPKDLVGLLYLKSSFARSGLLPWSQGIVEPGYSGSLTVAIHNYSNDYVPIVGGSKMCHLMFSRTDAETEKPYNDIYQHSASVTPAKEGKALRVVGDAGEVSGRFTGALLKSLLSGS